MPLQTRKFGDSFSQIEGSMIFDDKYSDSGYVKYLEDGRHFVLCPSPFLENKKTSKYCIDGTDSPPENEFIETRVIDEKKIDNKPSDQIQSVKTIDKWNSFDPSILLEKKTGIDPDTILGHFSKIYTGDETIKEEIAMCSILYSFSSPPVSLNTGGINAAILGKQYQWNSFKFPLNIIPSEMKRENLNYYYHFSEEEKLINRNRSMERSLAFLKPTRTISEIAIVLDGTSEKKFFFNDYKKLLIEDSNFYSPYLLDSLIIKPRFSKKLEKSITNSVYELNEEYEKTEDLPYLQNLGGAIPKLSSAYARFYHNLELDSKSIEKSLDLWKNMHKRAIKKYCRIPRNFLRLSRLTDDARKLYHTLKDTYGADYAIPLEEAFKKSSLDYEDFLISINSLNIEGFCILTGTTVTLIERYC